MTSVFRACTGTRHKARSRQVTGIPLTLITLDTASPAVMPSVAGNPGMPVTNANPGQEALTTALNAQAMEEQELPAPETALPATTANNESQLGISYLNNCANQTSPGNNISVCSSDPF